MAFPLKHSHRPVRHQGLKPKRILLVEELRLRLLMGINNLQCIQLHRKRINHRRNRLLSSRQQGTGMVKLVRLTGELLLFNGRQLDSLQLQTKDFTNAA